MQVLAPQPPQLLTLVAGQALGAAGVDDIAKMLRHADGGALAQKIYMHPKVRAVDFVDDLLAGGERFG